MNDDSPPKPAAPKPGDAPPARSPGRTLLMLSLVLNLLFVGMAAGMMASRWHGGHSGPGGEDGRRDLSFGPFTDALSRQDRAELRAAFIARAPDIREMRAEMRSDLEAVLKAVRAVPFDEAALRAAFDTLRQRAQSRITLGSDLLIQRIGQMTPEDRTAFAERLQKSLVARGRGE